jgi:hypothetical protein
MMRNVVEVEELDRQWLASRYELAAAARFCRRYPPNAKLATPRLISQLSQDDHDTNQHQVVVYE